MPSLLALTPDTKYQEAHSMARPSYASLKGHYRKSITSIYQNTCAIRMSLALIEAAPGMESIFKIHGKKALGKYLVTGAQDLAAVLRNAWGVPDQSWAGSVGNPCGDGVICYMNIPTFSGQGHIGLWENGAPYDEDAYWTANPVWFWRLN